MAKNIAESNRKYTLEAIRKLNKIKWNDNAVTSKSWKDYILVLEKLKKLYKDL